MQHGLVRVLVEMKLGETKIGTASKYANLLGRLENQQGTLQAVGDYKKEQSLTVFLDLLFLL